MLALERFIMKPLIREETVIKFRKYAYTARAREGTIFVVVSPKRHEMFAPLHVSNESASVSSYFIDSDIFSRRFVCVDSLSTLCFIIEIIN